MASKLTSFCDGCEGKIDVEQPHLVVSVNLQRGVDLVRDEAHLPLAQRGGVQTGAVVTLEFCKPECATAWFQAHEDEQFGMPDPTLAE